MPSAAEIFAASCAPGGTKILGARLRPVTVGHVVLLSRVGNSLVSDGRFNFDDLVSAVLILARDWKGGVELLERFPSRLKMALWERWCRFANGITCGDFGPLAYAPRQWALLQEWFAGQLHSNNWPAFSTKEKQTVGGSSQTPSEAFMVAGLMSEFGMTFEQVMNTPYTLARTMLAVNAERSGAGQCFWLDSDDHAERKEFLRKDYLRRSGQLQDN